MQSITSTHPSLASSPRGLYDDVTHTTHHCSYARFEANRETVAQLASRSSQLLDLNTCPAPSSSSHQFCGATDKPLQCFMGQITKPQLSVLRPKPGNPSEWFWGQTTRTVATGFQAKPGETTDHCFEAKPRNSCFSSPRAWCRPHMALPDPPDCPAIKYSTFA
jgi:hypothetical protein